MDEKLKNTTGAFLVAKKPNDLPAFCVKLVEEICEGVHEGQRERPAA